MHLQNTAYNSDCKNGNCLKDRLFCCFYLSADEQIYYEHYHRAVADHRLNVDSEQIRVNIAGIYHYAQSREGRERRKKRAHCIVEASLFAENRQQTDVHRRGTELERKCKPHIISYEFAVLNTKRKRDLFVYLKCDYDQRRDLYYSFDRLVGSILEKDAQKNCRENCNAYPH